MSALPEWCIIYLFVNCPRAAIRYQYIRLPCLPQQGKTMNTPYNLFIVDDDVDVQNINQKYFEKKGFSVRLAPHGAQALKELANFAPHCILLDVMMPGMDGFVLLEEIRKKTAAPVLFLTGRVDEASKIKGLLLGADDYVTKPYSLPELEARIIANIRRHTATVTENVLHFPPLEINIEAHKVSCEGTPLNLTNQEYDILYLLATNKGELVTFEDIGTRLWNHYIPTNRSSVMMCMSRLRRKMEMFSGMSNMVETVWGKGYRFVFRGHAE